MAKPRRPRRLRKPLRADLRGVIDETIALFYRVRWLTDRIYDDDLSNAQRGLLRGLVQFGAQTVPQLARTRLVSRQHVQAVVDALSRARLVELEPNPRHKRSRLVRVTAAGEARARGVDDTNRRVLAAAATGLSSHDLAVTVRTLRAIRTTFEIEPRWRRDLDRS